MRDKDEKINFTMLTSGDEGVILSFEKGESEAYRKKLLAMGLTPGTAFRVVRTAPLGDPVEITLRGYSVSLRRAEAAAISVMKTN